MSRSEQLESERVGPVDATMTQTLSRIMNVDGEEFDDKYVTMKAKIRYGAISSAILIVQKVTDEGEYYVQYQVDVDQCVALILTMPELATEAMETAMQVTTSDKIAEFEARLKTKGLLLDDTTLGEPQPATPPPPDSETELRKKQAEAKKLEKEIEALNIQSEKASRKKSGLRLDDDLNEKLKESRLEGVADILRKSRVSSMAMLKEH